jgi:hypothetical protein
VWSAALDQLLEWLTGLSARALEKQLPAQSPDTKSTLPVQCQHSYGAPLTSYRFAPPPPLTTTVQSGKAARYPSFFLRSAKPSAAQLREQRESRRRADLKTGEQRRVGEEWETWWESSCRWESRKLETEKRFQCNGILNKRERAIYLIYLPF